MLTQIKHTTAKSLLAVVLGLILLSGLSACGWQLQGQQQAPAQITVLTLKHSLPAAIESTLLRQLRDHGWLLTSNAGDSQALLALQPLDIQSRAQTINSEGQIAEYELVGRLTGSLVLANGQTTPLDIRTQVWYDNDVDRVSATRLEAEQQRQRLQEKLIDLLVLRLLHTGEAP